MGGVRNGGGAVKGLLWGGGLLFLLVFQSSDVNVLEFRGVKPDLLLIVTYCVGLLYGERRGLLTGLSLGLLMDLASMGPFYQNMVTKGAVGLLSGFLGQWLRHAGPFLHLWMIFSVSLLQGMAVALSLHWIYGTSPLLDLRVVVIPQALYDALAGSLILALFTLRREREVKVRWAGRP